MSYRTNKKEYFINLRSIDAIKEKSGANNFKFSWNIQNINVSQQAKLGISHLCAYFPVTNNPHLPYIIRCNQIINNQYDSAGGAGGGIIYFGMDLQNPSSDALYPLSTRNLDTVDLTITESINILSNGIDDAIDFYIQLKVIDYDTEEVNKDLMPTYSNKSLSFHYPNSSS